MRALILMLLLAACTGEVTRNPTAPDVAFDGTCTNCHAGLSAGHVHPNYKLRCVDCHGGDDQVDIPADAAATAAVFRDPELVAQAHVKPLPELARFFFANGIDDDNDGEVDEPPVFDATNTVLLDPGEIFEPALHGEGAGEFVDTELQRDLNYARFLNPGDLRVASVGCGAKSRGALDSGGGCHQQTIDVVRLSIMVNQSAVINGAYYGNESWRPEFVSARGPADDPREGAFGYTLDYAGADECVTPPTGERDQPTFDRDCLRTRAAAQDPAVAAGAPGNANLPAFELAQGRIGPVAGTTPETTIVHTGAGDTRYPWGGEPLEGTPLAQLDPVPNGELLPEVPDPVDAILRTFRAYYPLNYPGSTRNFNNTFGTSIQPEATRFATQNPYGRGHSAGCSACHAPYNYAGNREPTRVRQDDGTVVDVVDPTTKHREFDPSQDSAIIEGAEKFVGRSVSAKETAETLRPQQKTYSRNHALTTAVDSDTCGLCHGFVTRINLAYQGMAEEEQRDQLARRAPIELMTPAGTQVRILDSWVRADAGTIIRPAGLDIIQLAIARDAALLAMGLVPGAGGCAQSVFTEDCNNNGELDGPLSLQRVDEDGVIQAVATIDEDLNGNGVLDLIDRVPREKSIDGRQMRYVYGGRNGSTRQMDVHFERGMHCIDCHFLQDVHGDGHVYSTNWDALEIECEDCHGANARATLVTSGPNGGNDLRRATDNDRRPYFVDEGDAIVQRSRVTPGVFWRIPQTANATAPDAREAHGAQHVAPPGQGSSFAGDQGSSALTSAKLECAACHGSWIHNCLGCHIDLNLGDKQRNFVDAAGAITKSAAENEVWLANTPSPGHINFQLVGLMRSPLVLGVSSRTEQGRLGPFRSSMQAHVTVTDADGHTLIDNATFTTFQALDANSGRTQVATSAVAMNQTMPHTVRPREARGCETCHALVDPQGNVRNEHLLAQTYGLGTGAYSYAGDWAFAAGTGGLELFEHKAERELAANTPTGVTRFPGMIVDPTSRVPGRVEPLLDAAGLTAAAVANDVVLIRNFNPTPVAGDVTPPSLQDLAILGMTNGAANFIVMAEITARGHPASERPSVGNPAKARVLPLAAGQVPKALAHLSPDTSDPFVYVALGTAGVGVVRIDNVPASPVAPMALVTVEPAGGRDITDVVLAGDMLFAGAADGTVLTYSIANPTTPALLGVTSVGGAVSDMAVAGFVLYVGSAVGLDAFALDDPAAPRLLTVTPAGGGAVIGVAISEGHAYLARGAAGLVAVDMRTPALPGAPMILDSTVNAVDVIASENPGQSWLLTLDANGDLVGVKLDGRESLRERCYPDPAAAGCTLELDFYDPTIMGRDPSFDPVTSTFDAADPSAVSSFRIPRTILTGGKRLARPAVWETLGTLTGRRLRDSFMPGSGVLSLPVMQRMRGVLICESTGASTSPSGLGALGYSTGGTCEPFSAGARFRRRLALAR